MTAKTYGYRRPKDCPDPYAAKRCRKCVKWFNPRPRETVCDGCVTPSIKAQRYAKGPHPSLPIQTHSRLGNAAGQRPHKSEVLGLTFKPGVPLWRILALEAAAEQRWNWRGRRR